MSGKDITFEVNGQPAAGYLSLPAEQNAPGVVILHAWWGLNSIFKKLCNRLAAEGFVAFAPDLNNGKVAKTIGEAEQIMSELDFERKHAVAARALDFLRARREVGNEALSLIGFSMGASWSLLLAGERPADITKMVLFYGSGDEDFSKFQAEILGHYASDDEWEPLNDVRTMEAAMHAAGLKVTFHIYPNTLHWFFEEDRPEYDPQAARLAWTRTLEFLRE
jgi:carboxymethylenebutenolidase